MAAIDRLERIGGVTRLELGKLETMDPRRPIDTTEKRLGGGRSSPSLSSSSSSSFYIQLLNYLNI